MPNSVQIGILAFCIVVLVAMLAWAFFWPHKRHRYGMDNSKKAAKNRSRTAGRSHSDIEMHPKNWDEDENSSKVGKKRPMPVYEIAKDESAI
ncbi:predicted protein [Sclerotinia sclerotiorum 1980 UF-70]|uniref:Uncharacterized protein n=2 Tax=Sclerotinia sclerotiorum (strain ATCC 18683 / 1980 / Ss-1) TaxID=665079 RepID=A7EBF3_SCLS1|nr:predicted protein [Sclerotinia sclerotiorum 1980 UF-70]APA08838.1 hypothetical protein sscle_04g036080 [Sclerotinia sclerotiorum 1980 UF-70]EDN99781.1 predicted protein [Sclerotinia sclerotiorum 1980 UF-70]